MLWSLAHMIIADLIDSWRTHVHSPAAHTECSPRHNIRIHPLLPRREPRLQWRLDRPLALPKFIEEGLEEPCLARLLSHLRRRLFGAVRGVALF